jgi:ribosomal protein S18 acetylase RimI-like enzyme
MMTERVITFAAQADGDEILGLYRACIGVPGCTWSDEYPVMDNIREDIANRSLYVVRSGSIIAAATGGPCELSDAGLPWAFLHNPCELSRVAVMPALQGKGLASMLLNFVLADLNRRGFDGVRLLVSPKNFSALALYRRAGFTSCGNTHMFDHDYICCQLRFA